MKQQGSKAVSGQQGLSRRGLVTWTGAGAVAMGTASSGMVADALFKPGEAGEITDADILNFVLNLGYIKAEFYSRALSGHGLDAADVRGVGKLGAVLGGMAVPFTGPMIAAYAQRHAADEISHVRHLRQVLGSNAVARPSIDLRNSFDALAVEGGLVPAGARFNPFLNEQNFLLGSFMLVKAGAMAYAAAACVLRGESALATAASIQATKATQAEVTRMVLELLGLQAQVDAISAVQAKFGGGNGQVSPRRRSLVNAPSSNTGLIAFPRVAGMVLRMCHKITASFPRS